MRCYISFFSVFSFYICSTLCFFRVFFLIFFPFTLLFIFFLILSFLLAFFFTYFFSSNSPPLPTLFSFLFSHNRKISSYSIFCIQFLIRYFSHSPAFDHFTLTLTLFSLGRSSPPGHAFRNSINPHP